ncbi:radical SAM protein [Candidatus Woesearchaeota archaeon]|nr:radical SAM protein [Candidatus Woesearchaeota archaeon]
MIIVPNIPKVYKDRFPSNFVNDVADWGFTKAELLENKGKLLTMDIDFTSADQCSLDCPHCYSHNGKIDESDNSRLSYEEIMDVIKQGKELGLKSVKLLGRGEHTEHPDLIEFLEDLNKLDIVPLMFTKGHVIGDDDLVKKFHGCRGINTGKDLVKALKELNTRILLGFRSFDTEKEDRTVGNVKGYALKRNRALELLVEEGFNQPMPTYLGLMTIPVTKDNLDEAFDIYVFGKERNMYVCVTPTMMSGRGSKENFRDKMTPSPNELIELYTRIYEWNIEKGVQTLEQIKGEGVSAYAGSRPCQQVGCGLYVTLFGDVYICPGDDSEDVNFGNIRENSLKEIWENSPNYKQAGEFNCYCPAKDGRTIPRMLYSEVVRRLQMKYEWQMK